MARFISDISQIERPQVDTKYFNKSGVECDKGKHIASVVSSLNRSTYYALIYNGSIFDPKSIRFPRDPQYGRISKACFDKYLFALISGKFSDYEKATREFHKS